MSDQQKRLLLKEKKMKELKEQFESKFEKEKEKLNAHLKRSIEAFEEREKIKRELETSKEVQQLLKTEKERKTATYNKEIEEYKQALDRRLENFKVLLREQLETEKKVGLALLDVSS